MSVLGLDSGYTVKYTSPPSGVPSGTPSDGGVYLTVYPSSRPNTDTIWFKLVQYGQNWSAVGATAVGVTAARNIGSTIIL